MGWFDWLRRGPAPIKEHPRFGRVRASVRSNDRDWLWEALALIETAAGKLDMTFDAGEDGPDKRHEHQLDQILADRDALTRSAAPLIERELSDFLGKPLPDNPWDELELEFVHLSGRDGEFEMGFSCKSWPDASITAYFEQGRPTIIQIDD